MLASGTKVETNGTPHYTARAATQSDTRKKSNAIFTRALLLLYRCGDAATGVGLACPNYRSFVPWVDRTGLWLMKLVMDGETLETSVGEEDRGAPPRPHAANNPNSNAPTGASTEGWREEQGGTTGSTDPEDAATLDHDGEKADRDTRPRQKHSIALHPNRTCIQLVQRVSNSRNIYTTKSNSLQAPSR